MVTFPAKGELQFKKFCMSYAIKLCCRYVPCDLPEYNDGEN